MGRKKSPMKKKKTPLKKSPLKAADSDSVSDLGTNGALVLSSNSPLREEMVRGDDAPVSNSDQGVQDKSNRTEVVAAGIVGVCAGDGSGVTSALSDPTSSDAPPLRTGELLTAEGEGVLGRNDHNEPKSSTLPPQQAATNPGKGKMPSGPAMSWADCVTGKSRSLQQKGEKFRADSGRDCVKIPNAVIARNKKAWASFVLGQFHGNLPSMGALHAILNGIWSSKIKDISISRMGPQSVLIKIPNLATRKRVLEQGVWHIEGQTMFVGAWEPGLKAEVPELKQIPVWVDFKGVPPHFYSAEGMEYIAGLVGQPLHLHPRTAAMINLEVARVFTLVDLTEDLPEEVEVMFESGETHTIEVSCPWLPPKCTHCDQFGHSLRRCPTAPIKCTKCQSPTHEASECHRNKTNTGNPIRKQGSDSRVWKPVKTPSITAVAPLTSDESQPIAPTEPKLVPVIPETTTNEPSQSALPVVEEDRVLPPLPDTILTDAQNDLVTSLPPQQNKDPDYVDQAASKSAHMSYDQGLDQGLAASVDTTSRKPELMSSTRKSARVDEQGKVKILSADQTFTGSVREEAGDDQNRGILDKVLKPARSNAVKAKGRGLLAKSSS